MTGPRSIGVFSLAAWQAAMMAAVGLIAGVCYSFGGAAIDVLVTAGVINSASTPGVSWGTALAFMALIGMPFFFAVFGFAAGTIGALLYGTVCAKDPPMGRRWRQLMGTVGGQCRWFQPRGRRGWRGLRGLHRRPPGELHGRLLRRADWRRGIGQHRCAAVALRALAVPVLTLGRLSTDNPSSR